MNINDLTFKFGGSEVVGSTGETLTQNAKEFQSYAGKSRDDVELRG